MAIARRSESRIFCQCWRSHSLLLSPIACCLDRIAFCQGNSSTCEQNRSTLPQSASSPCSAARATTIAALARAFTIYLLARFSPELPTSTGGSLAICSWIHQSTLSCEKSRLCNMTNHETKTNTRTERFWETTMGVFTANGR